MKIAICDDELCERESLAKEFSSVAEKYGQKVVFEFFECGDQLLFEYEDPKMHADILFLDIHMPGTNGAKTAEMLRHLGFKNLIVFLTAVKSTEAYTTAFDVKAFHYIIKHEFEQSKIEEIFAGALLNASENKQRYFLFECAGECRNISIGDIKYFDVLHRIVTVHYGNNDSFEFYSQLDKVAQEMEAYGFIRTHRSYIVSLNYIESLSADGLKLFDGTVLPVSRRLYQDIKRRMEEKRLS